jgi:hypothetical protein
MVVRANVDWLTKLDTAAIEQSLLDVGFELGTRPLGEQTELLGLSPQIIPGKRSHVEVLLNLPWLEGDDINDGDLEGRTDLQNFSETANFILVP